jgi:hypothetical protein
MIDDEPTSKRRPATCASSPENSVPAKVIRRPSLAAIARNSSLSNPVKRPPLRQLLGGPPGWVPTVSVPGVMSPSASMFTEVSGSTSGVVWVSASCGWSEVDRFAGSGRAPSLPTGLHMCGSATAGQTGARL